MHPQPENETEMRAGRPLVVDALLLDVLGDIHPVTSEPSVVTVAMMIMTIMMMMLPMMISMMRVLILLICC